MKRQRGAIRQRTVQPVSSLRAIADEAAFCGSDNPYAARWRYDSGFRRMAESRSFTYDRGPCEAARVLVHAAHKSGEAGFPALAPGRHAQVSLVEIDRLRRQRDFRH
jgi:hypothetical protein